MSAVAADVLVIGSGVAGLTFALRVADAGRVAVVTKKDRASSNTNYAQGGIAAVMDESGDSFALHVRDTLLSGAGLCHTEAVRTVVREGPARVNDLIDWGVRFTRGERGLSLAREGGHSRRRIVHASDRTGREIERALLDALAEHASVEMYEDHLAVDLLIDKDPERDDRCAGAIVLERDTGRAMRFHARYTFLATGGLGAVYRHTTNPEIATGDGVAMAFRAGARVANLEFVQFHPTALYPAEERAVLISEAVRGEGAVLRTKDGEPLMEGRHPQGSLATRDVVARTIDAELKRSGADHVWLDLAPIDDTTIEQRFPNILAECRARNIDMLEDPIPVVPAAHYSCGGVWIDQAGRSSLTGLYAAGEVSCTGAHGANRLASNSLLEAVVYSQRAAVAVREALDGTTGSPRDDPPEVAVASGDGDATTQEHAEWHVLYSEVRALMWEHAGIVRSDERLERAHRRLSEIQEQMRRVFEQSGLDATLVELRNVVEVAALVVRCARSRKESRGLHMNTGYPYRDNELFLRDTVVQKR